MPSKKSAANQALGEALRAIRHERGLNQEAFTAHAGLARSNYGAIERGEFNVTLDTIVKLADQTEAVLSVLACVALVFLTLES